VASGFIGEDQGQPTGASEAGEVAHVDRCRDEQHVDLALAQLGRQARRAPVTCRLYPI
jgi:hypothetical protein